MGSKQTPKGRLGVGCAAAGLLVVGLTAARAQPAAVNMAASVKARQTHYKEIGRATKAISDELKTPAPSVAVIQQSARTIDAYAPQIQAWFPKGSGSEAGVKTSAKAEIWAKPDEFKRDAIGFMDEAKTFDTVAATGDLARIRAEFPKLGLTCKTCHEAFRARED